MIQNRKGDLLMILADTLRLLITITVCCCITGLLMWLFLLYNKKASIEVLLLWSGDIDLFPALPSDRLLLLPAVRIDFR